MIRLESKNNQFREQLADLTSNFDWNSKQPELIKYSRQSIANIINRYNRMQNKRIPEFKIGLTAGYRSTILSYLNNNTTNISFDKGNTVLIGSFAEIPLFQSPFSINPGLNLSNGRINGTQQFKSGETNTVIKNTSLDIPLLIRYTSLATKWRPYLNLGPVFQFNIQNQITSLQTITTDGITRVLELNNDDLINNSLSGITVGTGIIYHYNDKYTASVEVRYKRFPGGIERPRHNQLEFLVSYFL